MFLVECFSSTFHDLFIRETFNGMKNVFKAFVKCEIMSGRRRSFPSPPPPLLKCLVIFLLVSVAISDRWRHEDHPEQRCKSEYF